MISNFLINIYICNCCWVVSQQPIVNVHGEFPGDQFGYSVAMSSDGNAIAIGAIHNGGHGIDSGHVRVYQKDSSTGTQIYQQIGLKKHRRLVWLVNGHVSQRYDVG